MNEKEFDLELRIKLAQYGILEEAEIQTTKQKILASAAPALLAMMEGKSESEKALELCDSYFNAASTDTTADPSVKRESAPQAGTGLTAEDRADIRDYFDSKAEATGKRAAVTRVVCQLTDKPVLAMLHVPNSKLIPTIGEKTETNFQVWASKLVDTPENKKAFAEIKESFMKKEPMAVYVNPDAREKVIGWTIETTDDNGEKITKHLNKESAIAFLLVKVQGHIQSRGENSIGIRIRWSEKKTKRASNNEGTGATKGVTSVTVLNRKALQENANLSVCTCARLTTGGVDAVNDQYNAKTERYFEVLTGKVNKDNVPGTRKVRLPGKTSAYRVARKEEYVATFGPAERQKGVGMTRKEKESINDARLKAMAAQLNESAFDNDELREASAAIRRNRKATPGGFH